MLSTNIAVGNPPSLSCSDRPVPPLAMVATSVPVWDLRQRSRFSRALASGTSPVNTIASGIAARMSSVTLGSSASTSPASCMCMAMDSIASENGAGGPPYSPMRRLASRSRRHSCIIWRISG